MSEKCIHKWYSRITRFAAYEFFCMACGKTLTANGFEEHATNLEARIAKLEAVIDQLIEAGNALDVPPDDFSEEQKDWREIVKEWKESKK